MEHTLKLVVWDEKVEATFIYHRGSQGTEFEPPESPWVELMMVEGDGFDTEAYYDAVTKEIEEIIHSGYFVV